MKRRHGKCIFGLDPKEWQNKIKYSINLKHKRGAYHLRLHAAEREQMLAQKEKNQLMKRSEKIWILNVQLGLLKYLMMLKFLACFPRTIIV